MCVWIHTPLCAYLAVNHFSHTVQTFIGLLNSTLDPHSDLHKMFYRCAVQNCNPFVTSGSRSDTKKKQWPNVSRVYGFNAGVDRTLRTLCIYLASIKLIYHILYTIHAPNYQRIVTIVASITYACVTINNEKLFTPAEQFNEGSYMPD